MALSNQELASQVTNISNVNTLPQQGENDSKVFRRNLFINTEGAGNAVGKKGEDLGRSEEHVVLNTELQRQYETFLNNYLRNLSELASDEHTAHILTRPAHQADKLLFEQLTTNNEPDVTKIKSFLNESKSWVITTQLMERQIAHKLFALGLTAAIDPNAERKNVMGRQVVETRIDEGAVRAFSKDYVEPHLGTVGKIAALGGSTIGSALAAMRLGGGNDVMFGAAVAGAAALPIAEALRSFNDKGLLIDVDQSAAALNYIQSNPGEAEFIKKMSGIGVENFRVNGNKIEKSDGFQDSLNNEQAWQDILSVMYARHEFYGALGVPLQELDAIPEQFLFRHTESGGQMEQTGARWEQKAAELFAPNNGGLKDTSGRSFGDPGFDENNLDVVGNLERFDKARQKVMLEMVKDYIAQVDSTQGPNEDAISVLQQRENALTKGGTEHSKKIGEVDKKIAELEDEKKGYTDIQSKTSEYEAARRDLQESQEHFVREFPDFLGKTIDEALKETITKLTDAADPTSIPARRRDAYKTLQTQRDLADADAVTYLGTLAKQPTGNAYQDVFDRRRNAFSADALAELAKIEEEERQLKTQRDRIRELEAALRSKEDIVRKSAGEAILLTEEKTSQFDKARTELTAWGITPDDLTHKSLKDVMGKINTAHRASVALAATVVGPVLISGWAETDNNKPENILKVQRAIAEAKAQVRENFEPSSQNQRDKYNEIIAAAPRSGAAPTGSDILTTEQLIGWSNEDLMRHLQTKYGWSTNPADAPANMRDLEVARAEARRRLVTRVGLLVEDQVGIIDTKKKEVEKEKEGIKYDKEVNAIKLTKEALKRKGEIYSRTLEELLSQKDSGLVNTTRITAGADGYIEEETNATLPEAYYNFAEIFFKYKDTANRKELFEAIQYIMPPEKLAEWLNDSLGLGLRFESIPPGGVGPANILIPVDMRLDKVLEKVRSEIGRHRMPAHRLYKAMSDILGTVQNQAMTIAVK